MLSVNNRGNRYIIAPITDENYSHPNFYRIIAQKKNTKKERDLICNPHVLQQTKPVGDLENIPTGIPHLETLHTSYTTVFSPSHFTNCLCMCVLQSLFPDLLCAKFISGEPAHNINTHANDVRPVPQAGGGNGNNESRRTVSLIISFSVPPSMNSVIRLSRLSLYRTPMNLKTCWWSRLLITFTWKRESGRNTNF